MILKSNRWIPGQSGNLAGRPKGTNAVQLVVTRAMLEAACYLAQRAATGDLAAIELLLEQGRPIVANANRMLEIEERIGRLEQEIRT